MTDSTVPPGFLRAVTAWMHEHKQVPEDAAVTDVYSRGSDWTGSTEGGFYSTFDVDVTWSTPGGVTRSFGVEGEDMESLWRHVVLGYGAEGSASDAEVIAAVQAVNKAGAVLYSETMRAALDAARSVVNSGR